MSALNPVFVLAVAVVVFLVDFFTELSVDDFLAEFVLPSDPTVPLARLLGDSFVLLPEDYSCLSAPAGFPTESASDEDEAGNLIEPEASCPLSLCNARFKIFLVE